MGKTELPREYRFNPPKLTVRTPTALELAQDREYSPLSWGVSGYWRGEQAAAHENPANWCCSDNAPEARYCRHCGKSLYRTTRAQTSETKYGHSADSLRVPRVGDPYPHDSRLRVSHVVVEPKRHRRWWQLWRRRPVEWWAHCTYDLPETA